MISDRIIRPVIFIPRRDVQIHEAGHYVAGVAFGFPMEFPKVFSDGSGIARVNRAKLPPDMSSRPARSMEEAIASLPDNARLDAVLRVVALFLAGFAAEVVASEEFPDRRSVVGAGSSDLDHAIEFLRAGDMLSDRWLLAAWNLSLNTLRRHWDSVIDVAGAIRTTEPNEADRRVLAA